MIYYLIFIIGLVFWGFYIFAEDWLSWGEKIAMGFFTLIVTVAICVIMCFGALGIASLFANSHYEKTNEIQIIALQDNGKVSGSFFLGSGSIDGKMQYTYMTKDNNNEMEMKQIDIDHASLIYSNTPKVEEYEKFFDKKIIKFFFGDQTFYSTKYKIYIPERTIKENYNVDLK